VLRASERAANLIEQDPIVARDVLVDAGQQTRAAIHEVRQLAHQLHPPELDLLGLVGALREQADRHSSPAERHVLVDAAPDLPRLPAAVELAAYLITCEALTNVERHANASQCCVRLSVTQADGDNAAAFSGIQRILLLEVIDDGDGIGTSSSGGLGLTSMSDRATELGGSFSIARVEPHGTHLTVHLPCPELA
jgi:signal transduction histidine kinase